MTCRENVLLRHHVSLVVQIDLPGGTVQVEWDGKGDVFLSGPAAYVFEGQWLADVPR